MSISIRKVDLSHEYDATLLAYWDSPKELHEIMGSLQIWEENEQYTFTQQIERKIFWINKTQERAIRFMIENHGLPIGCCTIEINPPYLSSQKTPSAWIDIMIGNPQHRGKKRGTLALQMIEAFIKEKGISRIEVGISEINIPSRSFFLKAGYTECARNKNEFIYKGYHYDDIRYEKILSS